MAAGAQFDVFTFSAEPVATCGTFLNQQTAMLWACRHERMLPALAQIDFLVQAAGTDCVIALSVHAMQCARRCILL